MENKLTKFEISKHLNISRNRLNTLLKQLPPNKNEFDGRYYSDNYINRLRKKFENQLNINMDEFKKKNNCYNSCELEKKPHINRTKIKQLVKDNNLLVIKFGNYEFYNETTIEQIIKLNKPRSVFRVKDGIDGYIKYVDAIKELKISRSLLNKIIKTYKLNIINKCQVLFIKNEDFEFIKSLDIVKVYDSLISKHELCRICNISFNFLHYYSSFIGNLVYRDEKLFDPCLSSIEISRRGYEFNHQYILKDKDKKKNIVQGNFDEDKVVYTQSLEELSISEQFSSFQELYDKVKKSKTRYRFPLENCSYAVFSKNSVRNYQTLYKFI